MNPNTAKACVRVIPHNLADYGAEAVAAGADLLRLRSEGEDCELEFRELTAGGSEPSPYVIGGAVRHPSHAERAAIEADHKLADQALKDGRDLGDIGTPNEDEFRRRLASAKTRLEAMKRAEIAADRALFFAMRDGVDRAAGTIRARIDETGERYRQEVSTLVACRGDHWRARADLDLTMRLLDPDPLLPISIGDNGGAGVIRIPNRYVSLTFGELVELLDADAQLPAELARHEQKAEPADNPDTEDSPHMRSFRGAGEPAPVALPSADDRFNRDVPTRRRRTRLS